MNDQVQKQQEIEQQENSAEATTARDEGTNEEGSIDLDLLPKTLATFFLNEGAEEGDYRSSSRLAHRALGRKGHDKRGEASQLQSQRQNMMNSTLSMKINVESFRFIAYCLFWLMCTVAILLTKYVTAPLLLEGPSSYNHGLLGNAGNESENSTCAPFTGFRSDGFDIKTESHLVEAFGFNNICSNWDYTPSRELTAMVYPLFEYTFLIYIILDFLQIAVSYHKGLIVSRTFYQVARIIFPFQLFLVSMFRMIFVILAYVDVRGHTAGFLCMQVALISVSILNAFYILQTKVAYSWLGGLRGTRFVTIMFLTCNILTSAVKIYLTSYVVFGLGLDKTESDQIYPAWGLTSVKSDLVAGQVVDYCWMIFNAFIPMFISIIRSQTEPLLLCTIDLEKVVIVDEDGEGNGDTNVDNDGIEHTDPEILQSSRE